MNEQERERELLWYLLRLTPDELAEVARFKAELLARHARRARLHLVAGSAEGATTAHPRPAVKVLRNPNHT